MAVLCTGKGGMTPTKIKAKRGLACEDARTSKRRSGAVEDSALRMQRPAAQAAARRRGAGCGHGGGARRCTG